VTGQFFVIIADQIDNTQRAQIQFAVKEGAESWWHEFLDVWIVKGGESTAYWRDLLSIIVAPGRSAILVLALPEGRKRWASSMGKGKSDWLHEIYTRKGVTEGQRDSSGRGQSDPSTGE
jgi:hypothetical protein